MVVALGCVVIVCVCPAPLHCSMSRRPVERLAGSTNQARRGPAFVAWGLPHPGILLTRAKRRKRRSSALAVADSSCSAWSQGVLEPRSCIFHSPFRTHFGLEYAPSPGCESCWVQRWSGTWLPSVELQHPSSTSLPTSNPVLLANRLLCTSSLLMRWLSAPVPNRLPARLAEAFALHSPCWPPQYSATSCAGTALTSGKEVRRKT